MNIWVKAFLLIASSLIPLAGQSPTIPTIGDPPRLPSGVPSVSSLTIDEYPPEGLVVNSSDREAVRLFFNGLYGQSDGVPMNWTGNYDTGNAGTTSPAFRDAVGLRINWFRAMAGIPARVELQDSYNQKAQQAAFMMSVNNALNHFPPMSWIYYTADGATGAANSNLSLGNAGPDAVSLGYMRDSGANNAPVGHRRWVLYPQTHFMGTGDVPGGTYMASPRSPANAVWVFDGNYGTTRPAVRDDFVAWPPKGYVPYQVVFGRWSLSYPNADFSAATVAVSKAGSSVPVSVEPLNNPAFGENTIVWLLAGKTDMTIWPNPVTDETYSVSITNVLVSGSPRTFSYNVTVFDPLVPTPGAPLTTSIVPPTTPQGASFSTTIVPMPNAAQYEAALFRLSALGGPITPSTTPNPWTFDTGGYNPIEASSFHLYHSTFATQSLTLNKKIYVKPNASLSFSRRFTFATPTEIAHVQISIDDGVSWHDIDVEPGAVGVPEAVRVVDFSAYSGRLIRLRFAFTSSGSVFTSSNSGWYFNNVALTNAEEATQVQTVQATGTPPTALFSGTTLGSYLVTARTGYPGNYFGEWGPAAPLTVILRRSFGQITSQ
jgi:hypothetical protein